MGCGLYEIRQEKDIATHGDLSPLADALKEIVSPIDEHEVTSQMETFS